jgi:MFS family permease
MLLSAGGTAYLAQLTVTSSYLGGVLPALLIMGLGFGMIFAPAINTATAGVPRQDSGVASALVNTMQQVGGSIGISVLSTIAASATTSYLIAHHTGPQAPAIAATHGYTLAFTITAALLGLGAILAILMLPSRKRLEELTSEASALIPEPEPEVAAAALAPQHQVASELHPAVKVMPVGLLCCSPVIDAGLPPAAARPSL